MQGQLNEEKSAGEKEMFEFDVVWITGPRGSGKSTTAASFSGVACVVDTDEFLSKLNSCVPSEFRYKKDQSLDGFKGMPREDLKEKLLASWESVKQSTGTNQRHVLAGWHTQYEWLREVIHDAIFDRKQCREHFLCVIPSVASLVKNIRRRKKGPEIAEFCNSSGEQRLKKTIAQFKKLNSNWRRIDTSNDLFDEVANCLEVPCPGRPVEWCTSKTSRR